MKKMLYILILFFVILGIFYKFRSNSSSMHPKLDENVSLVLNEEERSQASKCLANIFWSQLSHYSPFYDFDAVVKNLNDLEKSKALPLNALECQQQMLILRSKISDYHAALNLHNLEVYLAEVATRKDVVEVIPQKVYYEVLQSGNAITPPRLTSKIHLIESLLEDAEESVIQNTRSSNRPITLILSDTIPGFAKGTSGMNSGERRKIYIHPDFAYGKCGRYGFQQLLICDVEVLNE